MKINNIQNNTMKTLQSIAIIASLFLMTSCDDDDTPQVINEEELITTVEYTLTNTVDATNTVVYKSVDADGDGPDAPVFTVTGSLLANSNYMGTIQFLNESESPSENITTEVVEEADEHEVFYLSSITDTTISKDDVDANGNPLGVQTTLQTGAVGSGTLTVVLRHEPLKPNDGSLSNAGGETDVQVVFNLQIQ
ncbi:hypothetical protein JCM19298_1817 [Nonlabens ulvanivorans]|nr:hypothetical protein JCM19298_1817 [Nonlabens ulvanivorans]